MMTGRDLVLQAIEGNTTERVPWVPFCGVHSGQLIGKTADELLRDTELVVQAQEKAIEKYS
ncbi:MAG: uroporphyrinogen decarboxylase, partial [Verrucomicrobiota bacterium]